MSEVKRPQCSVLTLKTPTVNTCCILPSSASLEPKLHKVKGLGKNIVLLADSSASRAPHTHFVLERQLIRLHAPEGTAKTSKHFVQALMAANRADNTLARVEMETEQVGVCVCVCACRDIQVIESLHHYSLTYSTAVCPRLVSLCNMRLITQAGLLVVSFFFLQRRQRFSHS